MGISIRGGGGTWRTVEGVKARRRRREKGGKRCLLLVLKGYQWAKGTERIGARGCRKRPRSEESEELHGGMDGVVAQWLDVWCGVVCSCASVLSMQKRCGVQVAVLLPRVCSEE